MVGFHKNIFISETWRKNTLATILQDLEDDAYLALKVGAINC
jgi:hypothetical protein